MIGRDGAGKRFVVDICKNTIHPIKYARVYCISLYVFMYEFIVHTVHGIMCGVVERQPVRVKRREFPFLGFAQTTSRR